MKLIAFLILYNSLSNICAQTTLTACSQYFEEEYKLKIYYDSSDISTLNFESKVRKQESGYTLILNRFNIEYQKDTVIIKDHLLLLIDEFEKYPQDYFKRIGLKYVCLLKSIHYGQSRREAVPDNGREALMLESSGRLIDDKTYLKYAFHHDLHHYAEVGAPLNRVKLWKKWEKLNPRKFEYFGSGAMQDDKRYAHIDFGYIHPREGFITNYALTADIEDRAEMAAYYLIPEYWKNLKPLLGEDKILKRKMNFIIDLLAEISGTSRDYWVDNRQYP